MLLEALHMELAPIPHTPTVPDSAPLGCRVVNGLAGRNAAQPFSSTAYRVRASHIRSAAYCLHSIIYAMILFSLRIMHLNPDIDWRTQY